MDTSTTWLPLTVGDGPRLYRSGSMTFAFEDDGGTIGRLIMTAGGTATTRTLVRR